MSLVTLKLKRGTYLKVVDGEVVGVGVDHFYEAGWLDKMKAFRILRAIAGGAVQVDVNNLTPLADLMKNVEEIAIECRAFGDNDTAGRLINKLEALETTLKQTMTPAQVQQFDALLES